MTAATSSRPRVVYGDVVEHPRTGLFHIVFSGQRTACGILPPVASGGWIEQYDATEFALCARCRRWHDAHAVRAQRAP